MRDTLDLELYQRHASQTKHDALVQALAVLVRHIAASHAPPAEQVAPPDPWLTPAEAARYASVSEDTLRAWIHSGALPAGRRGRVIRIKRSDIDGMLRGQRDKNDSAGGHNEIGSSANEAGAAGEAISGAATDILKRLKKRRK